MKIDAPNPCPIWFDIIFGSSRYNGFEQKINQCRRREPRRSWSCKFALDIFVILIIITFFSLADWKNGSLSSGYISLCNFVGLDPGNILGLPKVNITLKNGIL